MGFDIRCKYLVLVTCTWKRHRWVFNNNIVQQSRNTIYSSLSRSECSLAGGLCVCGEWPGCESEVRPGQYSLPDSDRWAPFSYQGPLWRLQQQPWWWEQHVHTTAILINVPKTHTFGNTDSNSCSFLDLVLVCQHLTIIGEFHMTDNKHCKLVLSINCWWAINCTICILSPLYRWFYHNGWNWVPVRCQLRQLMESSWSAEWSNALNALIEYFLQQYTILLTTIIFLHDAFWYLKTTILL